MTGFFDGIKPAEFKALVAAHRAKAPCYRHKEYKKGCPACFDLNRPRSQEEMERDLADADMPGGFWD